MRTMAAHRSLYVNRGEIYGKEKPQAPKLAQPLFDMLSLWAVHGTPDDPATDSEYADKIETLIKGWSTAKGLPLSLYLPGHSPVTPAEAISEASRIITQGLSLITILNTAGILAEAASLGMVESVVWAINNIVNSSGVPDVVSDLYRTPVDIGVKIPLQRRLNSIYQPTIPQDKTLASLRSRGLLSDEAYKFWMKEHGYPDWASEGLLLDSYKSPDVETLLTLLRRGFLTPHGFSTMLHRLGFEPATHKTIEKLRWMLPGYADIISIIMREGHLPAKWVEIPAEFITWMGELGYDSEWAKRLWGKHWVLPGVELLYEMFHKQIITYDDMVSMLKYHDFEPVWRHRLILNAYRMIPRVDLRRAYRYGMLPADELAQRYRWLGFAPKDADVMSGIATRESLDRYYTRLESVARAAYRKGKLSVEALKNVLKQVHTPEEAVDLVLEAEAIAKEAAVLESGEEPRTLTVSQILSLSRENLITREAAFTRLKALGYTHEDADLLLALSQPKPERVEVNRELVSAASALYREGLLPTEQFEGYLRRSGLTQTEIKAKIDAEELHYRLDYLRDLIALAKEAYRKDLITQDEFEARLLGYGMSYDRVMAISGLETLRKMPRPRPA